MVSKNSLGLLLLQYFALSVWSASSYWRYETGYIKSLYHVRRIEVGKWFHIECTRPEWSIGNLSWYFEEPWCEIFDSRLQIAQARCNIEGTFGFGVINGTDVQDYKILKVHSNVNYFEWDVSSRTNRTGASLMLDLRLKITEPNSNFQNYSGNGSEHSLQLTKLFMSKGEIPRIEFKPILKSSLFKEVEEISFDHTNGEWLASLTLPEDTTSVKVLIRRTSRYSLFDKFIRTAEFVLNTWKTFGQTFQSPLLTVDNLLSKPIQHPCIPDLVAYISSTGIVVAEGFSQNVLNFSAVFNVGQIESLVFTGHRILFVQNKTLFLLDENGSKLMTGLSRSDIAVVYTADCCQEVSGQQRVIVSLEGNETMGPIYALLVSSDFGSTFSAINNSNLEDALAFNSTKGIQMLDVQVHSVFNRVNILVNVTLEGKSVSVLMDYSFRTMKWMKLFEFEHNNLTRLAIPLSTSNITLLWSDKVLISSEGKELKVLLDLRTNNVDDTESTIENVVTDKNGLFIVQLSSGDLFSGMIGVGILTKISLIEPASTLLFDSKGQLIVLKSDRHKGYVSSYRYPLHAEVDSAVDMGDCELISFITDIVDGWYQIDIGEHIQIKVELISESSNTSVKIAYPPHPSLKTSEQETAGKVGRYFTKTKTIDVFVAENSSTIQRFGDIYTTLVVYPSNLGPICTRSYHQAAFFHLGCPFSRFLNLNKLPRCKDPAVSIKLAPFIGVQGNGKDYPRFCIAIPNRSKLDIETYFFQQNTVIRRVNEIVEVQELTGRNDFHFFRDQTTMINGQSNYSFTFEGDGDYIFIVTLDNEVSFCETSAYLVVTHDSKPNDQNSLAVTISVCLGVSVSLIYLLVSFLRYRHETILEHIKEEEIVKRKQELRYLSNLYDMKDDGGGVSSRRTSSMLKEGIRKRNVSLSAISEISCED